MTTLAWALVAYLALNSLVIAYVAIQEAEGLELREMLLPLVVTAFTSGAVLLAGVAFRVWRRTARRLAGGENEK